MPLQLQNLSHKVQVKLIKGEYIYNLRNICANPQFFTFLKVIESKI